MAAVFAHTQNTIIDNAIFNEVGQNQYNNCNIQFTSCLESASFTAHFISSTVKRTEGSREQLQVLASSIETLLKTLDVEYRVGRLSETKTSVALEKLNKYVDEVILCRECR